MNDLKIDDIRRQLEDICIKSKIDTANEKPGHSFSSVLENAIAEVNNDQLKAEDSIQNYVSGKETSLHNTLISLEKADISFRLMMQVRNKLLDAYQQVMRTNV
ncbi:MAG TPA: flagellar hook-basal body complex protein FliE [Candidatus Deferrimicrobium sp.]|nr:flagellar hook-basal body complex protein FliE [Candidatus Kapabacteria bacterium]HLP60309.1 flagellar hook-basal body complex protein FliE [Candidatus Deferrimicrobium sp.]